MVSWDAPRHNNSGLRRGGKSMPPAFCGRRATPPGIQIRGITERHGGKGQASAKLRRTLQLRISVGFIGQPAATNAALEGDEDEE